mmetsp:Transcript_34917/g.58679  ORF Transcript_34917/g.58679 Transcript_34917/m.58679 type:complete len:215 (-) Transcript_34917:3247-3891(-)
MRCPTEKRPVNLSTSETSSLESRRKMRALREGERASQSQSAPICWTKPSTLSPGLIPSRVRRVEEGPVVPEILSDSSSDPVSPPSPAFTTPNTSTSISSSSLKFAARLALSLGPLIGRLASVMCTRPLQRLASFTSNCSGRTAVMVPLMMVPTSSSEDGRPFFLPLSASLPSLLRFLLFSPSSAFGLSNKRPPVADSGRAVTVAATVWPGRYTW